MGIEKIFHAVEIIVFIYWAFALLWMISGSWSAFVSELCIALVCTGFAFVSVYIIIGICKLVEDFLKGVNYSGTSK